MRLVMVEEKNREIRVGENRLYLGENDIVHQTLVGEIDYETGMEILEAGGKLMNMVEGKVSFLIDLNRAGKFSSKARKVGLEIIDNDKTGKVAIYGMHPVARVLASFVMGVSKKADMRFFKTKEEALAWLKE